MDKKSGFLASVCALNAALSDSVTLVYYGLQAPTLSSPAPAHYTLHLRLSGSPLSPWLQGKLDITTPVNII